MGVADLVGLSKDFAAEATKFAENSFETLRALRVLRGERFLLLVFLIPPFFGVSYEYIFTCCICICRA